MQMWGLRAYAAIGTIGSTLSGQVSRCRLSGAGIRTIRQHPGTVPKSLDGKTFFGTILTNVLEEARAGTEGSDRVVSCTGIAVNVCANLNVQFSGDRQIVGPMALNQKSIYL